MVRKTELKVDLSQFSSFNIMSYKTDLISSLLNLILVDPGSILIYVGAYGLTVCGHRFRLAYGTTCYAGSLCGVFEWVPLVRCNVQ